MTGPDIPVWAIPAAKTAGTLAWRNRAKIVEIWSNIAGILRGKNSSIAFTGSFGTGKTVLLDHLTGEAFKPTYTLPEESLEREIAKVGEPFEVSRRIKVTVLPGQEYRKLSAVRDIFYGEKPVDGLVHVVANGFVTLRNPTARTSFINRGLEDIESYRNYWLEQEIKDFQETAKAVRHSVKENRKPSWMLVVPSKVDLYADQITQARDYYSPQGQGSFVEAVDDLVSHVGMDNFTWDATPVCSWLEAFEWNGQQVPSTLDPPQRNEMLLKFVQRLEYYCGGTA